MRPPPRGVYAVRHLGYPSHRVVGLVGAFETYVLLKGVSTDVSPPVLPGVCVWSLGAGHVMTLACNGMEPGCTVMGADDSCWGMWTALVAVGVMGSPPLGVMLASPWTVRRNWWPSAGSVEVSVGFGDAVEADGLESQCDFVPADCAVVHRPFPR